MKIEYTFSENEKKLIQELKKMGNTYNFSSNFDVFRATFKEEINDFIDNGLLYHSNAESEGSYVRYSVSSKGICVFSKANPYL